MNEGKTPSTDRLENVLVLLWNNKEEQAEQWSAPWVEPAKNIIKNLQTNYQFEKSSAEWSGRENGVLTDFWKSFGANNATAKTDISLDDKNISLKVGVSQLMSGGGSESTATFFSAVDSTNNLDNIIINKIQNSLNKFSRGVTENGNVKDALKNKEKNLLLAKENQETLFNELNSLFNNNSEFYYAFVKEAITGYKKFGKDSVASADYVLTSSHDGKNISFNETEDSNFIEKIMKKTHLTIRFKTTSQKIKKQKTGRYSYWDVVSLITKKLTEDISKVYEKNNGLKLNESVFDVIKKTFNFISNIFNKIKIWLKKNVINIFEFLNITPIIENEEIDWNNL